MGGTVNVAIRFADGTIVCQERWTNNIPYWLKRPALYESEQGARDYLALVADNDFVVDPGAPGLPAPLEGGEYGLVVVDYVNRTIVENNGYSALDHFSLVFVGGEDPSEAFVECAAAGRLRHRQRKCTRGPGGRRIVSDTVGANLDGPEALRLGAELHEAHFAGDRKRESKWTMHDFVIDTAPFTVERLTEGDEHAMQERLRELGFPTRTENGPDPTPEPGPRVVTEQEVAARKLLQSWKKAGGAGAAYRGTAYEDLPEETRGRLMASAARHLCDTTQLDSVLADLG